MFLLSKKNKKYLSRKQKHKFYLLIRIRSVLFSFTLSVFVGSKTELEF